MAGQAQYLNAMPALGRPTALARPAHAPAQLPAQLPAHVAWCVSQNFALFHPGAPVVGAAAASCQVHEMGVGGLLLRFAWPAAALAYKGLARDSNTTQSRVAWVGWLHTGCERACAPPSTLLRRLRRVVLPVKRDCRTDNPNSAGDYSSCAHEE